MEAESDTYELPEVDDDLLNDDNANPELNAQVPVVEVVEREDLGLNVLPRVDEPEVSGDKSLSANSRVSARDLSPEQIAALRPYIINLTQGQFSSENDKTRTWEVDAIFNDYLERELEQAMGRGEPLRLLFYAHGGLVNERAGFSLAERHIQVWRENNVYPLYFIWETGFFETVAHLLGRSRDLTGTTRDVRAITDPAVEMLARVLQGPRLWSGMKWSAQAASEPGAELSTSLSNLANFAAKA